MKTPCFISTKTEINRDYTAPGARTAACRAAHGPQGHHAPLASIFRAVDVLA
jgi:hypothetical protein